MSATSPRKITTTALIDCVAPTLGTVLAPEGGVERVEVLCLSRFGRTALRIGLYDLIALGDAARAAIGEGASP